MKLSSFTLRTFWIFCVACVVSPTSALASPSDALTEAIASQMRAERVPGLSIAVVRGDATIYARGFGTFDLEGKAPVATSTRFHLASITKTLTAISVMQLVRKSALELDQPVLRHLPWFRLNADPRVWKQITVRQLLSHSAGISRDIGIDFWMNLPRLRAGLLPTEDEARAAMSTQEVVFPPGTRLKYSNMGFMILGELVAAYGGASGTSPEERYRNYVIEHVLKPLGMKRTDFIVEGETIAAPFGMRDARSGERPPLPELRGTGPFVSAWGLISSVDDMSLYLKFLVRLARGESNAVLDAGTFREMTTPVISDAARPELSWGLGFTIVSVPGEGVRVQHGGSFLGHKSVLALSPSRDIGVIVMGNAIDLNRDAYANLAYKFLGSPQADSDSARRLESETSSVEYDNVFVRVAVSAREDGRLFLLQGGYSMSLTPEPTSKPTQRAYRIGAEGGYSAWIGEKLVFDLDGTGKPTMGLMANAYRLTPLK